MRLGKALSFVHDKLPASWPPRSIIVLGWGAGSTFTNNGTIRANGGNGGNGDDYGGGGAGGGIIRLIGPGAASSGTITVNGGAFGVPTGGPGGSSGTNSGAGGTSGGFGGNNGYGNSGYVSAGNGGTGLIISTNIADPIGLFQPGAGLE